MSLKADELLIREYLTETLIAPCMPVGGRVMPAPIYFADSQDYWATIETVSYTTQPALEKAEVIFCVLRFLNFVDLEPKPAHSPLFGILYELYVFEQYEATRADENLSPDAFNKKMLKRHNEFVACCLDLKEAFQGNLGLGILDTAEYSMQETTSLVQSERVQDKVATEFVPGIVGHLAKFQETVRLKKIPC